jgi:SulP family sulfate permease
MQNARVFLQEFHLKQFAPNLTAGLVIGMTAIFFQTSLAALIFSGELAAFLADGIGIILFGGLALAVAVTLFGSLPGTMPSVQDSPAAIFALATAAIASQMLAASAAPEQIYITVVASLALTTMGTGLLYMVVGRFGLSSFVRFVPYPVVGGFLAGTGWLLVQGALGVMSGLPMHLSDVPALFRPEILLLWLPGAGFALVLLFVLRRFQHPLLMLGLLLGGVAVFYGVLFATHTSIADASARGLLLGPFPSGALWSPIELSQLALIDWRVILTQLGKFVSVAVVSLIALLLNANALELATRKDIDLNRELIAAGAGNVLGGLGGSPVGYQTIGMSALAHRMGGGSRSTTLIATLMIGAALLFGASVLSFFPKAILGGLLFYLGLSFLVEWVVDAWKSLPHTDYFLVLIILVIVAGVGFLQGVGAGVVIAVILFAVNYSRVEFVKDTLTGVSYRSNMERPIEHRQLLDEQGGQIHVLRLQGFLFFGTAQNLLNRIRDRIHAPDRPRLHYLVLDFHRVASLDSSAVLGFTRIYQLAEANQIHLVLTELRPLIQERLAQGGLVEGEDQFLRIFPQLDYGMEWCENRVLAQDSRSLIMKAASLQAQLRKMFAAPDKIERFMQYLERVEVEQGRMLINQGDAPDCMYFVDSGQVAVQLEVEPGQFIRLRKMGGGTVVGEIGMYLEQQRTASIVTTLPSVVYRLSEAALRKMERDDPDIATALNHWMVQLLAQRLTDNNRALEALLN